MSPPILTDKHEPSPPLVTARTQPPTANDEYAALWAMNRAERTAAMWRSELTLRQLCQWSSRAQHEVPLLAGELAWIVMRTPEWAETTRDTTKAA